MCHPRPVGFSTQYVKPIESRRYDTMILWHYDKTLVILRAYSLLAIAAHGLEEIRAPESWFQDDPGWCRRFSFYEYREVDRERTGELQL